MKPLPVKLTPEVITVTFDFTSLLAWGEVIVSTDVTVQVFSGLDYVPEALLSGSASFNGSIVSQTIQAGLPGVVYSLNARAITATHTYTQQRLLAVISDEGSFQPATLVGLTGTLPGGTVGVAYSEPLTITGGFPPYRADGIAAGTAPFWMNFSVSDNLLMCAGTPNEATETSYSFTPRIADEANNTATSAQSITIVRLTLAGDLSDGDVGDAVSGAYTSTNGTAPVTFEVLSGTFPPGITLNADGTYVGTYTTEGTYSWVIQGTDANGVVSTLADSNEVALWRWWLVRTSEPTMYVTDDPINGPWESFVRSTSLADGIGNIISTGTGRMLASSTKSANTKGFLCPSLDVVGGVLNGTEVEVGTYNLNWWFDNTNQVLVGKAQGSTAPFVVSEDFGETFTSHTMPDLVFNYNIVQMDSGRWIAGGILSGSVYQVQYTDATPPTSGWTVGSITARGLGGCYLVMTSGSHGVLLQRDGVFNSVSGASWNDVESITPNVSSDSRCVLCDGDLLIQSNGQNGDYYISRDGGATFSYESFGVACTPFSMFKHQGVTVVNTASGGGVLYSDDDEMTWTALTLPFTPSFDEDVCIAPLRVS